MTMPDAIFEVDYPVLATRLDAVPHEIDDVLRLFDGRRTLAEVLAESEFPDGDTVLIVTRLRREGVLVEARPPARVDAEQAAELAAWLADEPAAERSPRGMLIGALVAAALTFAFVRLGTHRAAVAVVASPPVVAAAPAAPVAVEPPAAPTPAVAVAGPAPTPPVAVAGPAPTPPEPAREEPATPREDPTAKVGALVDAARAQLDKGRVKAALASAQAAIALDAEKADAWLFAGTAHQELGHDRDARTAYQKYLALAPSGAHANEIRSVLRSLR